MFFAVSVKGMRFLRALGFLVITHRRISFGSEANDVFMRQFSLNGRY
jgi:hypothetical protein